MHIQTITFIEASKYFGLSIACLYGSLQIKNFMMTKLSKKYATFSNIVIPPAYMYALYYSRELLLKASSYKICGFAGWMVDQYMFSTSLSYFLSMITLVIGYPTIHLLFNMAMNKFSNYIEKSPINKKLEELIYLIKTNKYWKWNVEIMGIKYNANGTLTYVENAEELEKLVPLRSSCNKSDSKYLDGNCSVCCEELNANKLHRELKCGHVFHPECVDPWLLNCNANCPMCRETILIENNENKDDKID